MTGDDDTSHLEDYLDADFIIVDEFSMVDTWLANQLFSNISSNSKILIVGDSDQLPSVSPGQVLADLLQIPLIPQTRLERIYRQSEESTIVTLASQIRQGILPADFTQKKLTAPTLKLLVAISQLRLRKFLVLPSEVVFRLVIFRC